MIIALALLLSTASADFYVTIPCGSALALLEVKVQPTPFRSLPERLFGTWRARSVLSQQPEYRDFVRATTALNEAIRDLNYAATFARYGSSHLERNLNQARLNLDLVTEHLHPNLRPTLGEPVAQVREELRHFLVLQLPEMVTSLKKVRKQFYDFERQMVREAKASI